MKKINLKLLSDSQLLKRAGKISFDRGVAYYKESRVNLLRQHPEYASFQIVGTQPYSVELYPMNGHLGAECTCPYAVEGYFCKHMVAAGLFLRAEMNGNAVLSWREPLNNALVEIKKDPVPARERPYFLVFSLVNQYGGWSLLPYTLDVSRIIELTGRKVENESSKSVIELIQQNAWLGDQAKRVQRSLGETDCINCSSAVISIANVIRRTEKDAQSFAYYGYTRPIEDYLSLLRGTQCPIFLGDSTNPLRKSLVLSEHIAEMCLQMTREVDGSVLLTSHVKLGDHSISIVEMGAEKISSGPMWVLSGQDLYQFSPAVDEDVLEIFLARPEIRIPREQESEFLENYLLPLADTLSIEGEQVKWEEICEEPVKRLVLMEIDQTLIVQLMFAYGEVVLPFEIDAPEITTRHKRDGTWTLLHVHRKNKEEVDDYRSVSGSRSGLKYYHGDLVPDGFTLRSGVDVVDFLLKKVPTLIDDGFEIFGEDLLTSVRVNRNDPKLSLVVSSGIDWFDLAAVVSFGGVEVPLNEVRRALRKRKKFVKLADGSIGELPEHWVQKYKHLFGLGTQSEHGVRLSKHHIALVEELIHQADETGTDEAFKANLENLRGFAGIPQVQLPEHFNGTLRSYQKAGYDWLHFLKKYGFGGCLADDMGLGKTVQVLAFLQSIYENGTRGRATLVVLPRSLLFNWHREAEKFTPGLRIMEHFGQGRGKDIGEFDRYDIVMTTYGTMRRDIQLLRTYPFAYAVLDESQAIKNPLAQVSKAARLLNAEHRILMTGTPVENSTYELWSQFTFLNPGMLGKLEYFKREFAKPIEKDQDEEAAELLRKLVYPFILRRTKRQVAPELPPRTERIVYAEMDAVQKRKYKQLKEHYRGLVLGMIEEKGLDDSRMKILEGLLRLRQMSNHPLLVDSEYTGKSAKMEMLIEHLVTLQSEGHKALVFSQFVKMLQLIRKELDARGIRYEYLDGKTMDRKTPVDTFQQDENIPFFLISLRAGGVGLNLTAADYVIHVDPWWNPAVETQAADRTHRIGQDKPVFIYKLITRDSVEEKILILQEKKKNLADQLISAESSIFKDITPEDVRNLFN